MIHVIGDSQVTVFSGKEHSQEADETGFLPFFRTYNLGSHTAYNVAKRKDVIDAIVEQHSKAGDCVMLCFGEIDCRLHLVRQSEIQQRPVEDLIRECISRYAGVFDIGDKYGVKTIVWNVPPSSPEDIEGVLPTYGSCQERNRVTRLFNEVLEETCKQKGVFFVSIFDELVDAEENTRAEYYVDQIHLSQRAMPLILSAFRKQELIDMPLRGSEEDQDGVRCAEPGVRGPTEGKTVLVWLGIGEIAKLIAARPRYDVCYVLEADDGHFRTVQKLFGKDDGVRVLHMAHVDLSHFCRQHGIEKIELLVVNTKADTLSLIGPAKRLLDEKRVNRIECDVHPDQLNRLSRMCGDAYDIGALSEKDVRGMLRARCELTERRFDPARSRAGESRIIDVVYAHLTEGEAHSVHRGNVSVVWSRMPLQGCDLYLYVNAYSFTGKQNGVNVLLLHEPAVVLPAQYDANIWSCFDHVITFYDGIIEGRDRFIKTLMTRSGRQKFVVDSDITEGTRERAEKYPLSGRVQGICMINGNKSSSVAGELYSKRVEAALWFHEHSTMPFDVFGNPPFSLPNYRGVLPGDAKLRTLGRYRYNLCFENVHHAILSSGYVDKILSCLETRTIPIYLGAPDIDAYIPRECFIDLRSFSDYGELDRFLSRMSEKQYMACIESIDDFVNRGGLRPYSWDTLYDQLIQIYAAHSQESIEEAGDTHGSWEWGLEPASGDRTFRESCDPHLWPWGYLANGSGKFILPSKGAEATGDEGDEVMVQSADKLLEWIQNTGDEGLQEQFTQVRSRIESGLADVNDHYFYAQCFISAQAYDEAVPALNRVLEVFPDHSYALNDLGVIHFQKKDLETAFSYYSRAVKAEPRNAGAFRNLLNLLRTVGRQKDDMVLVARELLSQDIHDREVMVVLEEFGLAEAFPVRSVATVEPLPTALTHGEARFEGDFLAHIYRLGLWKEGQPLRLHLGCGEAHLEGYLNIDYPPSEHTVQTNIGADVFADISLMSFPDATVDEVRMHHVFEHFDRPKALALLIRWHGWLKPGGRLHIETPDLAGCAELITSPEVDYKERQALIRHLFGSHEASWAYHYDGWSEERFRRTLGLLGFSVSTRCYRWQQLPRLANVVATAIKDRSMTRGELLEAADAILLDSMVADVPAERKMHALWFQMVKDALRDPETDGRTVEKIVEEISIPQDSPDGDRLGFGQTDSENNGEFFLVSKLIQKEHVVFDVGANRGSWSGHVLSVNKGVRLFAFEPVPETFQTLRECVGHDVGGASFFNMAVSDVDGEKVFYHYTNTPDLAEMSTFYRRYDAEKAFGLDVKPIAVKTTTLDSFCLERGIDHIDFVKIDTEGGEYDVLTGAAGLMTARKIGAIQFEYGGTFKDAGISLRQTCSLLSRFGYSVFRILPDRLLHIREWRNELENYEYSNYLAVSLRQGSHWAPMQILETSVAVVFSKDRAMQVESTLRTLHSHCRDIGEARVKVIYTTSNYFHERGYEKLKKEFPFVEFVKEKTLKNDLLSCVSSHPYVLFLVDDNIFVRDFRLGDATKALEDNPLAVGFSLRLGRNTTSSYMQNRDQSIPVFDSHGNGCLSFDWTTSELDFGYPLEVSSSVYRASDVLPLLNGLDFSNPNTLEALMDANKGLFGPARPRLLCHETSVTFCNPANKVQNVFAGNRAGSEGRHAPDRLANMFLKGYRIDGKEHNGFIPKACHQEVDLHFLLKPGGGIRPGKQRLADRPIVSIAIPNYNGLKHIGICLESIAVNTPEDHEIIVVDNGSTDGSLEYLRTVPNIVLVENSENLGAPGARNQALSIAQGDYVIFMDNDTIVTKSWVSRFIDHAEKNPDVGIIGACTNYATGPQRVADASYSTVDELEVYAAKRGEEHRGELLESPRLISFCIFFKRDVVDRIGGMDTSFSKFCFEDDDYSLRATVAGLRSVVALDVFIHHTGGPQGRGDKEYNAWLAQAWEGFRKKWGISDSAGLGQYDPRVLASRPFAQSEHYVPLPDRRMVEELIRVTPRGKDASVSEALRSGVTADEHFKKALAYEESGDIDLAIEELERVLAIDDGYAEAYDGLGVLFFRKGDTQKALQLLSMAVMLRPNDISLLKNLAAVALEAGETEDAIGLYENILSLEPEDVEALLTAGGLCEQSGQTENALRFLDRALKKEPANAQAVEAVERIRKSVADEERAPLEPPTRVAESVVMG